MSKKASVKVNAAKSTGILPHNWNYIGMDECNFIHTPEGRAVLSEFGRFAEKPYYVRPHFLFCTGNEHGFYKWGSTNLYREDAQGSPVYAFRTIDLIFDTILEAGCKPFVELGFMPEDLVDPKHIKPEDLYKTSFGRHGNYKNYYHNCPPKDYVKWQNLVTAFVSHLVERYGKKEVEDWYFELWNEPDIFYWRGTHEEFVKLYDYTVAGIEAALPSAYIGGPTVTGIVKGADNEKLLDAFLDHCRNGVNYVTGQKGTRLDYVTFHVKGGGFPFMLDAPKQSPSVKKMLSELRLGLEIIKKHGYGDLEVVLSEADPDGWAAGGIYDNVNMSFRNTSYYASFVAASFHHMQELAESMHADVRPLSWAFVFRGERCFEGTRAFQTQGIDKPMFHYFRMAAMMGQKRIELTSDQSQQRENTDDPWADELAPEVNGFATSDGDSTEILLYCHHDDQWSNRESCEVELEVSGLAYRRAAMSIYQVDKNNCNAHTLWQNMGRPHYPEGADRVALIEAGKFKPLVTDKKMDIGDGGIKMRLNLPVHSVCVVKIAKI